MTIVSGTVGAILGAQAQKSAAAQAAAAQEQVNQQQIAFQKQLLGDNGMPVFLPWYAKNQEQDIFNGAYDAYNALTNGQGSPADQLARAQAITSQYAGLPDQAVSDITSGRYLQGQLNDQAPVGAARSALASGQKEGVLEGLADRLNTLKADAARQGFTGGGSFANSRLLSASIAGRQAAANAVGQANLQNAQDIQNLRNANRQLVSQTQFAAPSVAQQRLALTYLPNQTVANNYAAAQALFNPFKRPGSGPLAIQPPPVTATASPWQLIAQNNVGLGNTLLSGYLKSPQGQSTLSSLFGGGGAAATGGAQAAGSIGSDELLQNAATYLA